MLLYPSAGSVLSLFSVPKPFHGQIGVIQENAIRSWTLLGADHEIILFGAEEGTAEVAARLEARHEPDIRCSRHGAPLVSSAFERAQRIATHDWLCYVNCDIVLMSDLPRAVRRASDLGRPVLVSGRRWRLEVDRLLAFEPGWEDHWRRHVAANGWRDSVHCMDYFAFQRGLFPELPEFALGRGRWDSYLPYKAAALGALFVDATDSVIAVHQNHDYRHPDGKVGMRSSPDGFRNRQLAGAGRYTLRDADHRLTEPGLRKAIERVRLRSWLLTVRRKRYVGFPLRRLLKRWFAAESRDSCLRVESQQPDERASTNGRAAEIVATREPVAR
jgi:hypothetical protein